MSVFRRVAGAGVLTILLAGGMVMLAGLSTAGPAAARVSSGGTVPAGSGGAQLWLGHYSGPGAHDDFPVGVAVAHAGSPVFVTGNSMTSATTDYATVAYQASTGAKLWARRYAGPGGSGGNAAAIAAGGGKVFVTGYDTPRRTGTDYVTIAYNASTGAPAWLARYGLGSSYNFADAVAVSPDGREVFVTGSGQGAGADGDYATVAYDAATGTQLWASRYSGPGNTEDHGASLAVSPDGARVYVTGRSGPDIATIAYDAVTGKQLWVSRRNGDGSSIAVSPDGHVVYVTGTSGANFATTAYSAATGTQRWTRRYNGGASASSAGSMALSPDGKTVYVTGSVGLHVYATIAYDAATGARRWARQYGRAGKFAVGINQVAVGPRGHTVYITGGFGFDIVTVAYDAATGVTRWASVRPGDGISLAVSPVSGTVFVTGYAHRAASAADYITIAYHG